MRLGRILPLAGTMLLTGGVMTASESISGEERRFLVDQLKSSREGLRSEIQGLSEAQWNFKPNPFRWSIREVLDHVAVVEGLVIPITIHELALSPQEAPMEVSLQPIDPRKGEEILRAAADRERRRFQAPAFVRPVGRSGEESWQAFAAERDVAIEFARSTDKDLRTKLRANPVFGELDAYHWLVFVSAHSTRHLEQIREVKANAAFPR